MNATVLRVQMLGELTLSLNETKISENQNRSKKMWALMAYLLYHRHRIVSRDELLDLLWGSGSGQNPVSAMKTALHRTRALMDDLYPGAGHDLILQKEGGYCWNTEIPMELDIDRFQELCQTPASSSEQQIESWLEAMALYRGPFLTHMSSELWVLPIATYYQSLYVQTAEKLIPLLERKGCLNQIADICHQILPTDPYNESIHRHLMRAKIDLGDQKDAMSIYEELSRKLSADFGVMPEESTRSLYREAMQTVGEHYLPMELIQSHLREEEGLSGALICDYSFFKTLCYVQARAMTRLEMEAHVILLSITDRNGKPLSKQARDRSMKQLEHQLQNGLRRGDTIAKCSGSQYIALLPYANYQNSCMVCERIIQSYFQNYPNTPAVIQYLVHGLEPYA